MKFKSRSDFSITKTLESALFAAAPGTFQDLDGPLPPPQAEEMRRPFIIDKKTAVHLLIAGACNSLILSLQPDHFNQMARHKL
ncbi:MAG: hypothetical protein HY895_14560 [Deltaproteobacteria bacterium]|nr:hypothetical protein [Deltaproteobacteria bacterium]